MTPEPLGEPLLFLELLLGLRGTLLPPAAGAAAATIVGTAASFLPKTLPLLLRPCSELL
jgi:hypothetical protein